MSVRARCPAKKARRKHIATSRLPSSTLASSQNVNVVGVVGEARNSVRLKQLDVRARARWIAVWAVLGRFGVEVRARGCDALSMRKSPSLLLSQSLPRADSLFEARKTAIGPAVEHHCARSARRGAQQVAERRKESVPHLLVVAAARGPPGMCHERIVHEAHGFGPSVGAHARVRMRGCACVGAHAWVRMRGCACVGARAWVSVRRHTRLLRESSLATRRPQGCPQPRKLFERHPPCGTRPSRVPSHGSARPYRWHSHCVPPCRRTHPQSP